ncbi:MAG: glycosyltransferase family 2 protein [Acidimicrobiales bacterium]
MASPVPREPSAPAASVAVCVIAYEAATTIEEVLASIPSRAGESTVATFVSDDASSDDTAEVARRWAERAGCAEATEVVRQPVNLGYGGNQRACFRWALEHDVAALAMLHGDAQYPGAAVADLLAPILAGTADVVLGSRMLDPGGAQRGGMPAVRRVGNRALSWAQNQLTGIELSEWHTGMRAYRTDLLRGLDLDALPSGFDFDTAATLAALDAGARFAEIPIDTRYAGEVSRIPLWRTGAQILGRTIRHRWRAR